MARDLDTLLAAALLNASVRPLILVQLTFASQICYVHSGVGTFVWDGMSFLGVGSLGPTLCGECMADIQLGAPAKIWIALLAGGTTLIGAPYLWFSGAVDKPVFSTGGDTMTIALALENKLINLARPSMRRYTSADQRLEYPTDTAFSWVEQLNDQALIWGQ